MASGRRQGDTTVTPEQWLPPSGVAQSCSQKRSRANIVSRQWHSFLQGTSVCSSARVSSPIGMCTAPLVVPQLYTRSPGCDPAAGNERSRVRAQENQSAVSGQPSAATPTMQHMW